MTKGQVQKQTVGDVDRSSPNAPKPLGRRLRRCRCCTDHRRIHRTDFCGYWYRVVAGAGVFTGYCRSMEQALASLKRQDQVRFPNLEIVRVACFGDSTLPAKCVHQYELVRGGKWVDDWQAKYGRHKNDEM